MGRISGLAEVVLLVRDLEQSVAFYRDLLGLTVISPEGFPAVFLRVGDDCGGVPQQIVLIPRSSDVRPPVGTKDTRDLHHIGLEVRAEDYEAERNRIAQSGIPIRGGEHPFLPVEAFYFDDPDGNEIEVVARVG